MNIPNIDLPDKNDQTGETNFVPTIEIVITRANGTKEYVQSTQVLTNTQPTS